MTADRASIDDLRIDRRHRRRGGAAWVFAAILIIACGSAGAWWWTRERPVPVKVAPAVATETRAPGENTVLNASGYVTARRRATVSSKVTGKVIEVLVEEGKAVRQGQVLARLDPSTATTYLTLARAELDAARRALTENEVRLGQARTTLARTKALVAEGVMTQADLDAAQAEVDAFDARLALAREQVTVSERQVAVRENDLADLTITAPFSGVAISKDAQPGEMVSPVSAGGGFTRTGICTVVDMSSLEIEVDVNESYINRVSSGQRVQGVLDAYPDWPIPGKVITMVPTADRQKATVLVRIGFDRLDPRILPDMGIKVAFLDSAAPKAARGGQPATTSAGLTLTVPRAAVRQDGGRDVVFVVRDGVVERRAVRLGAALGDNAVILAGLEPGEQTVVEGPKDLRAGMKVKTDERK
jgi:HlyD family secretion protein